MSSLRLRMRLRMRWLPACAPRRCLALCAALLAALLLPACSNGMDGARVFRGRGPGLLLALPMLPDGALALDGSYRVQVHDDGVVRELILVVRSDNDGFRFEAIDELGLPQLVWPVREDLPPAAPGVDPAYPGIVARMIQLSLAEPSAWTGVLAGTPWRLDVAGDGVRTLLLDGQPRVRVDAPSADVALPRALLYCPGGIASPVACAQGRGMAIDVAPLEQGTAP